MAAFAKSWRRSSPARSSSSPWLRSVVSDCSHMPNVCDSRALSDQLLPTRTTTHMPTLEACQRAYPSSGRRERLMRVTMPSQARATSYEVDAMDRTSAPEVAAAVQHRALPLRRDREEGPRHAFVVERRARHA